VTRLPILGTGRPAPRRTAERWPGDAQGLAERLRADVAGEVRFDDGSRALYATDASNYRQVPIGVVVPRSTDDVLATVAACREFDAPLLSRGGGTSLAGQTCNVAVVIDWSKYLNRVLEVDPDARTARVQPGVVLDHLQHATGEHGLVFPPDPATHNRCTIGGMIGNNSCGVHSVMAGKTVDNVEALEVLLYDGTRMRVGRTDDEELAAAIRAGGRRGEIHAALRDLRDDTEGLVRERYPEIPRRVSGYNLDELLPENRFNLARALVGTEGTCATVLEATLNLAQDPPHRTLAVLGFPEVFHAADAVPTVLEHEPIGLEGLDDFLIGNLVKKGQHEEGRALLPEGGGWLLAELGGDDVDEVIERARRLEAAMGGDADVRVLTDPGDQQKIWEVRESGLGATAQVPGGPDAWPGWEDSAVAPERLGGYLRDLSELFDEHGVTGAMYGHFGDGCLHVRITFGLRDRAGVDGFRSFLEDAADLVTSYGGSLSGEHGDGQARGELLERMYGQELVDAFRRFKTIWDPTGRMNPGKVVDADGVTDNLRLGADWAPWTPDTVFAYPKDDGSFLHAQARCVGVGECRKTESGTMCPSYMATREEQHSTRGRARMLFELLEGDPLSDGWRDEHVHEALDLCLSCKACKSECPVNVDMATYKAEFLHHHWKGRLRPAAAYAMGLIPIWARAASLAPRLANSLVDAPLLGDVVKRMAGVSTKRSAPDFADETLRAWLARRRGRVDGEPVTLFLDTFTNYFTPEVGRAAVTVLEAAGYRVEVPEQPVCCGRPLYEFGMVPTATGFLRRTIRALEPQLRAGTPILVLEPSCASALRDELVELLPDDPDALRLSDQTRTFAELLAGWQPPQVDAQVLVQRHCHQQAIIGYEADLALLERTGADVEVLDSGCCGMAGSFGYEDHKYDVSVACAERVLVPRLAEADDDVVLLADGFSCRSQVADLTDREGIHLAQLLAGALDGARSLEDGNRGGARRTRTRAAVGVGLAVAGAAAAWRRTR
jgi:FAD/FMN-containing dehydrogenase/Fe-S oxidoreductase